MHRGTVATTHLGSILSRQLTYRQRRAFINFAEKATVGHWAEVIDKMRQELLLEDKDVEILPTEY